MQFKDMLSPESKQISHKKFSFEYMNSLLKTHVLAADAFHLNHCSYTLLPPEGSRVLRRLMNAY